MLHVLAISVSHLNSDNPILLEVAWGQLRLRLYLKNVLVSRRNVYVYIYIHMYYVIYSIIYKYIYIYVCNIYIYIINS